jgi:hypothetical protein
MAFSGVAPRSAAFLPFEKSIPLTVLERRDCSENGRRMALNPISLTCASSC